MLQRLIIHFPLHFLPSGRLWEVKTKENFKLFRQVVVVAYERWSLTRGSKYSDLTWKLLVCWKTGCTRGGGSLREVVATGGSTVGSDMNYRQRHLFL